jgi:hypothetical protein
LISGTIAANGVGNYTVTVGASLGTQSTSVQFLWAVSSSGISPPGSPPSSPPGSPAASPPGLPAPPAGSHGLTTTTTIVSVQNSYPGFFQQEIVTVDVGNPNGYAVNSGAVTVQVNGQSVVAAVHNGVAVATVNTSFLDFGALFDLFFAHPLTASYGDSTGVFAPSGAGVTEQAILLDYLFSLLAIQTQQLTQLQV